MKKFVTTYKQGAVFFGVCGGKLSEGIDFADDMARLVVVAGIPFGYLGDNRNKSKMAYLDQMSARTKVDKFKLSGRRWYELKAMRTMSQAIGRVIRHKDDYGAILFFDERMERPQLQSQLSSWVKQQIKVEENLVNVIKPIRQFFKDLEVSMKQSVRSKMEDQAIRGIEEDSQGSKICEAEQTQVLRPRQEMVNQLQVTKQRGFVPPKPTMQKLKPADKARLQMSHFSGHSFGNLGGGFGNCEFEEESRSHSIGPVRNRMEKENRRVPEASDSDNEDSNTRYNMDDSNTVDQSSRFAAALRKEEIPGVICQNLAALTENMTSEELKKNSALREVVSKLAMKIADSDEKKHECKICYERKDVVMAGVCGHLQCNDCWKITFDKQYPLKVGKKLKNETVSCPFCKQTVKHQDLRRVF